MVATVAPEESRIVSLASRSGKPAAPVTLTVVAPEALKLKASASVRVVRTPLTGVPLGSGLAEAAVSPKSSALSGAPVAMIERSFSVLLAPGYSPADHWLTGWL